MGSPSQDRLKAALAHLLRPLVRTLLRHGVAYGEFAEIAKGVYVQTAQEDFPLPNRKQSTARIAILTGLTRKEVKALREARGRLADDAGNSNRATRVLSGWYQDPEFTDAEGAPRVLPLTGKRRSFAALVQRYSGDMPPRAILEELRRVRCVEVDDDDRVHVLSRAYVPVKGDPEGLRILGTALHDLGATLDFNLDPDNKARRRLQRSVFARWLPVEAVPVFRRMAAEQAAQLLKSLDNWLQAQEADPKTGKPVKRTGLGVYYFEEEPPAPPPARRRP